MAGMVRERDERLYDAVVLDVTARVAKWLARRTTEPPTGAVPLPGGQEGLAVEIAASRVSVNRALKRLEARGLITVRPREVRVRDAAGLRARANLATPPRIAGSAW